MTIEERIVEQRAYYRTGATRPLSVRLEALHRLHEKIKEMEGEINGALYEDLGKSPFESYMTEVGLTLSELRYFEKHLKGWAKKKRVPTPLSQFHARSYVVAEPYGTVLVMSPWNYPFMLCMVPVFAAIGAGNTVVIKPSAYSPATSRVIEKLITSCFGPELATVVQGGRAENAALLEQKFDYIFFTGSVGVGKLVMEKASRYLTPVTLELGGKSPCIIDATADIPLAARRLAFGKFLNVGQTCVAPDYVLVHSSVKNALVEALGKEITAFFGPDPLSNKAYGKIVNSKHFHRLKGLMEGAQVLIGGQDNGVDRIAPTVLGGVTGESPVMKEEIFGPLLPVLPFEAMGEVYDFIEGRPKPLAAYLFTTDQRVKESFLERFSFGGGCVNDTIIHLATSYMGFGGVGESGMGSYHGKGSFDTFTHYKSVVEKSNWMDLPIRYQPYTKQKEKLLRKFLK